MTIRKGQDWGSPFAMPSDCMVVASDADAARSEPQAPFYVSSGDLHEALGKPRQPKAGEECQLLPIDAMQYTIQYSDGKELSAFAISSITIGRWYRGAFFVLSNSGFHQSRHLLPPCSSKRWVLRSAFTTQFDAYASAFALQKEVPNLCTFASSRYSRRAT